MADMPQEQPDGDAALQDVSLIDNQIAPPTDAPETPAEQGKDDAAETQDKPEIAKEVPAEGEQPPAEKQEDAPDENTDQKQRNAEMAQRRIQQRTKQDIARQLDESYGPKTQEQLQNEGLSQEDARYQALREELAYDKQRTEIAELNAGMQIEAVNVVNDFPIFNPKSKNYDPDFATEVEQAYRTAARVQVDDNNIVTNAEIPLYDFYQRMNNIYSRGATKGTQEGQANMAAMLSRTEDIGGSSSTSKGPETFEELEARLGDVVIT